MGRGFFVNTSKVHKYLKKNLKKKSSKDKKQHAQIHLKKSSIKLLRALNKE